MSVKHIKRGLGDSWVSCSYSPMLLQIRTEDLCDGVLLKQLEESFSYFSSHTYMPAVSSRGYYCKLTKWEHKNVHIAIGNVPDLRSCFESLSISFFFSFQIYTGILCIFEILVGGLQQISPGSIKA